MNRKLLLRPLLGVLFFHATLYAANAPIKVGSKKFTESVILGEAVGELLRAEGFSVRHQRELGSTRVLWNALVYGDIDLYPEYTGTLQFELLAGEKLGDFSALKAALEQRGIGILGPLGFNNTYAIGVPQALAEKEGIKRLSDLRRFPQLRFGLSSEFAQRADGWPSLKTKYELRPTRVRTMDHEIAYRAIEAGEIDAIDLYSTDAEIEYYRLKVLEDDLHFFPEYQAVILYRLDLEKNHPGTLAAMSRLKEKIPEQEMIRMNAAAKIQHRPESEIAAQFLQQHLQIQADALGDTSPSLWSYVLEHLALVAKSLFLAVLVALPLGIAAWRFPRLGHAILSAVGLIQTVPALALLVLLIQPLKLMGLQGIGETPAIVALFLYSLLPMVRNTHAGLSSIPNSLRESAETLGLSPGALLRRIYLPLASPTILAGVKTAAVLNVGFATLGALIGAGGLGQPILTGIRLDDPQLISSAAGLAAGLALVVQLLFEGLERWIVPRGLRL